MIRIFTKIKSGLNVVHINAQSLKNKIEEFRYIFECSNVDVVCVSETWFSTIINNEYYKLRGYKLFRADRQLKNGKKDKKGGGVAIYVKNTIQCKLITKSKLGEKVEFLFLELCNNNEKLLLGNVYRPNKNINTEALFLELSNISVGYENILISGDFNCNTLVDSTLTDEMKFIGLDLVNTTIPTHFSSRSSSLLDLFFTNSLSKVQMFDQISAPVFSKHDLIFINFDFKQNKSEKCFSYRDFKHINFEALYNKLSQIWWDNVYFIPEVDDKLNFIQQNIESLFNEFVPLKTKRKTTNVNPWFTSDIKSLIDQRNIAYARWKRFKTSELQSTFKSLRNRVNTSIKIAKSSYYKSKFSSCVDSKARWNEIRNIGINKSQGCTDNIDVDELNRKFTDLPDSDANVVQYRNQVRLNDQTEFQFNCFYQTDVYKSFLSIKSNATSYDGVHPKFIKIIFPFILPYITNLFNTIITRSMFPTKWKHAKIVPVPKSENEFRPIAILPFLSKVLERLMHNQILDYVQHHNLLTPRQSGFRPQHSCVSALIDVSEYLRSQLDNDNAAFLILLDHSKAFDTVNADILTLKLNKFFNFSSSATKLMFSYLTGRSQSVFNGNTVSNSVDLTRGVPQGSILGPLLYSVYANDLPTQLIHCRVQMYADDVQLYIGCKVSNIDDCVHKINVDLENIRAWASSNGLCLNPSKSKCIFISKKRQDIPYIPDIFLGQSNINICESVKNLGVTFNKHLLWSNHVSITTGKIYGMLRNLWCTQWFIPFEIRMLLAKTYLIPTLLYGCELYSGCDASSLSKLKVAFNNITRYVFGISRMSSISQYSKQIFGVTFENLLRCRSLIYLHKIIYTNQPKYLYDKIIPFRSDRGFRIIQIPHSTHFSDKHFFIYTISIWNHLPHCLQTVRSATQFKKMIFDFYK